MWDDDEIEFFNSKASFETRLRNTIQIGLISSTVEKDGSGTVGDVVDSIAKEVMKFFDDIVDIQNDQ